MEDAREKYNAEMRQVIDQSNVQWRRSINTANNAEQNRVNQLNVQTDPIIKPRQSIIDFEHSHQLSSYIIGKYPIAEHSGMSKITAKII